MSDNGVSKVWREGKWVYKKQPKFLTENEVWCLEELAHTGYVPLVERVELEVIKTIFCHRGIPGSEVALLNNARKFLIILHNHGIRHGDLTLPNVIINGDSFFVVDWAESRLRGDPRPDKRTEGDEYWLKKTIQKALEN
jgi:tRNA A-37 threonylcarbamoyl transferase component Bud32